ncbi:FMN-dependent NADH-azoreductase [Paenibacillus sp. V4I9]|nr:FMN-dependent NADH-azoreductase [Paenibacillus sp. V4I9]
MVTYLVVGGNFDQELLLNNSPMLKSQKLIKKPFIIQASGGEYTEGPAADFESGHSYLKKIIQFHGVPSFEGIFVEGMASLIHSHSPTRFYTSIIQKKGTDPQ